MEDPQNGCLILQKLIEMEDFLGTPVLGKLRMEEWRQFLGVAAGHLAICFPRHARFESKQGWNPRTECLEVFVVSWDYYRSKTRVDSCGKLWQVVA